MADHSPDHAQDFWRVPVLLDQPIGASDGDPVGDFAAMAEYLPVLCWIARGDGSIFWYNRRWHDYCGTTPSEMDGWGWQSVHDPERLPGVLVRWTAAISAGAPFEMAFPLRGIDGKFHPFLTRVVPIRNPDGAVVRWFGVNMEIGAQIYAEQALEASEANYQVLTEAMPQMVWSTLPDGFHDYYNSQWYAFTGVPQGSTDGEGWSEIFHPDDQERAWERWRHSLATGETYEIEYRLRHNGGDYRWVLGRAYPVRGEDGTITRWIGTCTDIDAAKRAAEENVLLSRELSHRIKNIFAVISGLVSLSVSRDGAAKAAMNSLQGRIAALGRAHDFARPHSERSRPTGRAGSLHGLFAQLLDPYMTNGTDRVTVRGEDVGIDDRSATPIALIGHELATNSAKYGALSEPEGVLTIDIERDGDDLVIVWKESGGPPVPEAPTRRGFGSELTDLSVERQLGGSIEREWLPDGLKVTVRLHVSRLHRPV